MNAFPLIRVALADDHTILRKALAELIDHFPNVQVILQADNGKELLDKLITVPMPPDICILDYSMPVMNGYETLLKLKKRFPHIRVLALSMYDNEYNIIKMLSGAAGGYLFKNCEPEDMCTAIRSISDSGVYYSKHIPIGLFKNAKEKILPHLTERKIEYLTLCCQALSDKQIADMMQIKTRTVEDYRSELCGKLNVKNKIDLVVFAMGTGIITRRNPENNKVS